MTAAVLDDRPADVERRIDRLTRRERQVLELIAAGLSNAAIADQLFLAMKTVEHICTRIFTKLDLEPSQHCNRRVLAVLVLLREG